MLQRLLRVLQYFSQLLDLTWFQFDQCNLLHTRAKPTVCSCLQDELYRRKSCS